MTFFKGFNAFTLKLTAMLLMLSDHTWYTLMTGNNWMTIIGRIAFPIFAFQIVEGFFHTHDLKKYILRVLIFALIAEIPFNLMIGGGIFYPYHQNVLFTFLIALLLMTVLEKIKAWNPWAYILASVVSVYLGYYLGFITMVDYNGCGILMVLLFYFCHTTPSQWFSYLSQREIRLPKWLEILPIYVIEFAVMYYINWEMLGGLVYNVPIFGHNWQIPEQGFALLALIPIWLYNGKQGPHNRAFQYASYAFYPVHMLVLWLIALSIF